MLSNMMSKRDDFKDICDFEDMIIDSVMQIASSMEISAPEYMELLYKVNPSLSKLVTATINEAFGMEMEQEQLCVCNTNTPNY